MAYKAQFGTRRRDNLYSRDKMTAYLAGRGKFPICPHCDRPVTPGQLWDEVHVTVPKCFGGKSTAVGHRLCNRRDNHMKVTPAAAKAANVYKKHVGIKGPGLGAHPMPGGRRSGIKIAVGGGIKPRTTHAERHAAFLRQRYFVEVEDIDGPIEVHP